MAKTWGGAGPRPPFPGNYTRNESRRCEFDFTLETSVEDASFTLETSVEDASFTLETSGEDASFTLETSGEDASFTLETSVIFTRRRFLRHHHVHLISLHICPVFINMT
jgi:hypothetical protein